MTIHITEFDPLTNKSQKKFLRTFYKEILPRAEKATQFIILSGAMGSGKSVAVQYLVSRLAMEYKNLKIGVGRISINEAKNTFFKELKTMTPSEVLSKDNSEELVFKTGSTVSLQGWGDGNVRKIRSNNYHMFVMEEVTEDNGKEGTYNLNKKALAEVVGRVRNPGGPNIIFLVTNPDDPEHWLYKDYILKAGYVDGEKTAALNREENVWVFYSVTTDNPHLKEDYRNDLLKNNGPNEAKRYVYGQWVSLNSNGIYNEYDEKVHYKSQELYKVNKSFPIYLSWDFNTAAGKPMSACMFQYINDTFHIFDEVVLEDSNTKGVLEELRDRDFFKQFAVQELIILGDSAGWSNQSSAEFSDYIFMEKFIKALPYKVNFKIRASNNNPDIKARHKAVNLYFKNLLNEVRIYIYAPAHNPTLLSTVHRGFKSTVLKKGSMYKEDDSNPTQHITTAFGYGLWYCIHNKEKQVVSFNF